LESLNIIINQFGKFLYNNAFVEFIFNERSFIHFVSISFLILFFAYIIDIIFIRFLSRFAKKTKSDIDDQVIKIIHNPLKISILYIGMGFILSIYSSIQSDLILFIAPSLLKTVLVIYWASAIFKIFILLINWYASSSSNSKLVNAKLLPLFDNMGKIIIFIGAAYLIMTSWGINPVGWLASAGVLGIVLGLAAKDTIANLFSGIFIMVDSPYKEGDYINLDSGERGYVMSIGIRSTRIMTRDDIEITIPNSVIANAKIINESGGPHENERVRLSVGVAYGSDVDLVKKILVDIAKNSGLISEKFDPRVRFREFGESSLNFQLLFWIDKPEARGRTIDALNTAIYKEFNKHNIEIPFPQRTVHIKK